jgi:3-deoxy-D-manno-octulosonic-acid transferase
MIMGARLSARSAARWQKLPNSLRVIYRTLSLVSPQDHDSGSRFTALGAPNVSAPNNLKQQYQRPPPHADLAEFAPQYQAPFTILAASTHAGEEKLILDAFDILHHADPRWHLILAPRHPKRRNEILGLIGDRFSVAQYSSRTRRTSTTQITLADTMGDMSLWYDIADICVVAGSFQSAGGHTPFEPLSHGCGVFHGPQVSNFTKSYDALNAVGGAKMVHSAVELSEAILTCRPDVMCDAAAPVLDLAQDQLPFYTALEKSLKKSQKAAS